MTVHHVAALTTGAVSATVKTVIKTEDGVRVSLNTWDDGGAWLHLAMRHGTSYVVLTRNEAERLLAGLQALLTEEVAA